MMRGVDPGGEMLLAQLARIEARLGKAQREISSGLAVSAPSDAPDRVSEILQLRAGLQRTNQVSANLARVQSDVDTADAVLQRVVELLEACGVAGMQGAGTLAGDKRLAAAQQVRGIQEQLVAFSRTSAAGRYLFSGDLDQAPCYALDLAAPEGVERLAAPSATRRIEHPSGVSFEVARTAGQIFDDRDAAGAPSSKNVFAAVHGLAAALEAGDDAALAAAMDALKQASAHVNAQLGFYGAVQNRIAGAVKDAAAQAIRLKTALGAREDADLTASILELQQAQLNQSAALEARAQIRIGNLFDYLK